MAGIPDTRADVGAHAGASARPKLSGVARVPKRNTRAPRPPRHSGGEGDAPRNSPYGFWKYWGPRGIGIGIAAAIVIASVVGSGTMIAFLFIGVFILLRNYERLDAAAFEQAFRDLAPEAIRERYVSFRCPSCEQSIFGGGAAGHAASALAFLHPNTRCRNCDHDLTVPVQNKEGLG